jgi:pimeloyl-ACP methyl ester carboxylesterase
MKRTLPLLLPTLVISVVSGLGQSANVATPSDHAPLPAVRTVDLKAPDGMPLKATYFPAAKPRPGVLWLHQINRDRKSWDPVAAQLAAAGINTLTIDMRGIGESGTRLEKLTDAERSKYRRGWPDDVDVAVEYLSSQPGVDHNLIGLGGAGWLGSSTPSRRRAAILSKSSRSYSCRAKLFATGCSFFIRHRNCPSSSSFLTMTNTHPRKMR